MTRVSHRLSAFGYAALATVVCRLPEWLLAPVFRLVADIAWRRRGRGVRQLERNLRRVVGPTMPDVDLAALTRRAMRSYARYWMEFFRLPAFGADRVVDAMHVDGKENLDAAMAAGRGAILALPHSGNWDHAGAWVAAVGYPFATVAERLEPASVFDRFVAVREKLGMEVLPLDDPGSFGVLRRRLREGKLVCLVCERDLSGGGVEVSFFGEPMTMPAGPAALALATGAALLPTCLWFQDDGSWGGVISPEIAPAPDIDRRARIADMTQRLADVFAAGIAAHPQDWHMLQPLWRADRSRSAARPGGDDAERAVAEAGR